MGLHQNPSTSEQSDEEESEDFWHAEYCDVGPHYWHGSEGSADESPGDAASQEEGHHVEDSESVYRGDADANDDHVEGTSAAVQGTMYEQQHGQPEEAAMYWWGWEEDGYLVIPKDDWDDEPNNPAHDGELSATEEASETKTEAAQAIKDMLSVKGAGA